MSIDTAILLSGGVMVAAISLAYVLGMAAGHAICERHWRNQHARDYAAHSGCERTDLPHHGNHTGDDGPVDGQAADGRTE